MQGIFNGKVIVMISLTLTHFYRSVTLSW